MSKVFFYYADVSPRVIYHKRIIRNYVETIFSNEDRPLFRVDYVFCSDAYLLNINKMFLNHHFLTDIITFDLSDNNSVKGEIYISVERVKENALKYQALTRKEQLRVIFHGALHLCGYNDKTKSEITIMRERENYYLSSFEQIQ